MHIDDRHQTGLKMTLVVAIKENREIHIESDTLLTLSNRYLLGDDPNSLRNRLQPKIRLLNDNKYAVAFAGVADIFFDIVTTLQQLNDFEELTQSPATVTRWIRVGLTASTTLSQTLRQASCSGFMLVNASKSKKKLISEIPMHSTTCSIRETILDRHIRFQQTKKRR